MDLHKPKPIHSLKEFLGELVTVTVGILIALALDALVENYRTDRLMNYARDDFRVEITQNRAKLADDLKDSQDAGTGLAREMEVARQLLAHQKIPDANLTITRTFVRLHAAAWASALSTQAMVHFPHEQERAVAEVYSEQDSFTFLEQNAEEQWFNLSAYAIPNTVPTDDQIREGLRQGFEAQMYLMSIESAEKRLLATYDQTLKVLGE